jgi:hypothetical protein
MGQRRERFGDPRPGYIVAALTTCTPNPSLLVSDEEEVVVRCGGAGRYTAPAAAGHSLLSLLFTLYSLVGVFCQLPGSGEPERT